jgi:hypothetical protein
MAKHLAMWLSAALLVSSSAHAVDHLIPGRLVVVKEVRLAKFKTKVSSPAFFTLPNPGGSEDPTINGAQVRFFDTTQGLAWAGDFIHNLPAGGWTGLGTPPGSRGYKYRGDLVGDGVCQSAYLRDRVFKVTCKSTTVPLNPPFLGTAGVLIGVPNSAPGAAIRYCAEFGGTTSRNDTGTLKRKFAGPPPDCPALEPTPTVTLTHTVTITPTITNTPTITQTQTPSLTPTVTNTATVTNTSTETPTRTHTRTPSTTPTITQTQTPSLTPTITPTSSPSPTSPPVHKCMLGGGFANSYVNIYSAAFPVALAFDTTGSSIDVGGAGSVGFCAIQNFNPIFIIGIGFVCIQPGAPCPDAPRYCGPGAPGSGPALGVDVRSDGNIGACTGNPACEGDCDAYCPGGFGAGFTQLSSGCTGYCTGGAGNTACTADAVCSGLGEGACNGPDNLAMAQANICQCSCIKTDAFGGSDPGDLQCNLGANLTVEMGGPCNGTDVLIEVGNACIPLSTQRAFGRISDGNFVPGSTVPSMGTSCMPPGSPDGSFCNDQSGAPIPCATLDASTTTGLVGVGAVNFFGSTIGDLSVGLKASCQ